MWRSYKTKELRDRRAEHYVRQGSLVWMNEDGTTDGLFFLRDEDAINFGKPKVYVVTWSDWDEFGIDSIWAKKEDAEERERAFKKEIKNARFGRGRLTDVEEWDVQ